MRRACGGTVPGMQQRSDQRHSSVSVFSGGSRLDGQIHQPLQVRRGNGENILVSRGGECRYPVGLVGHDPLEQVADIPGVAEVLVPILVKFFQVFFDGLCRLVIQPVVVAFYPAEKDVVELLAVVVGEKQILVEPGFQSRDYCQ